MTEKINEPALVCVGVFFLTKNKTVFASRTWVRHVAHTYSGPLAKKYAL